MGYLILASLLWAPSFPLVRRLGVDPDLLGAVRLTLAAVAFAAFSHLGVDRRPPPDRRRRLALAGLGAVQFGLMYVLVHRSYAHLEGHEVALFTVLTPLWVACLDALLSRAVGWRPFAAAALACAGSLLLVRFGARPAALSGFLLVQGANLCFAAGQVVYARMERAAPLPHVASSVWCYLGGAAVAVAAAVMFTPRAAVEALVARDAGTLATLVYLGVVPTAIGFHLWNRGAARVPAGVLAAANQLKVPLAVAVALAPPFREPANLPRLGVASAVIAAALLLGREPKAHATTVTRAA